MRTLLLVLTTILSAEASLPNEDITTAISRALSTSCNGSFNFVHIAIQTETEENKLHFTDVLDEVLTEGHWEFGVKVDVNNEHLGTIGDFNLWMLDSFVSFRNLYPQIKSNRRDTIVYFLIVLKVPRSVDANQCMQGMFSDLFRLSFVDVSLILESPSGQALLYTFFPFTEHACRCTRPVQVEQFNNNNAVGEIRVFPPKIDNFHGCPIRLVAQEEDFLFDAKRFIQRMDRSGLEGEILLEVADRLNCSVTLYQSDRVFRYRRFNAYGETAAYKQLEDGDVDIMIGFIIKDRQTQTLFTTSRPYLFTWLVIALRRPAYALPAFSWLLSEFDNVTWGYIALMIATPIVCILLSRHISRFAPILNVRTRYIRLFDVVESAVGMSIMHPPRGTFFRRCFITWSLGMLVIRATYHGKMFDSYRRLTYPKPPGTVRELIDRSYVIYSRPEYIGMVRQSWDNLFFSFAKLRNVSVINDTSYKKALIVSKYILFSKFKSNDLENIITQNLRTQFTNFLFQKHSPLAPKVNTVIERLYETGIVKHIRMRNEYLKRSNLKVKELKHPEPISLNRFRYLFVSYFCLLLLAFMAFLAEVTWPLLKSSYADCGRRGRRWKR